MHICFITHEYPKKGHPHGGVGTFVQTMARALVQRGHTVSVVGQHYISRDEDENDQGVAIYRLKKHAVKGLSWWFNAKDINTKLKALHAVDPITIVEASELGLAFIKKLKGVKYVIRLHGGHHFFAEAENRGINLWKGFQEKRSFKKADGFVAVSNYVKTHTEKYLDFYDKPLAYSPSPIDLERFYPRPDIKIKRHHIAFVGTVCEKKGIRQLILAMPKVLKEVPDAILHIYGRDWYFADGTSYIDHLKTDVLPNLEKGPEHIIFHGPIPYDEIPSKYAEAEVCVFPSHMETQGLVAPEAMAMGKPVVFSELGPGPEIIEHQTNGLLCDPHSPDSIAECICELLINKEEAESLAKKAAKSAKELYSIEAAADRNTNFYRSLIRTN
ncbi:glycosyltransferase family 4 protein [Sungkyunkwania multivorans]|uniref:Glycosyltransferase family 4 protein n=1 Tax=Sungkyunkwania multivorans TaxID=1173618 RepID=A0ABW3D2K9_9FLAO